MEKIKKGKVFNASIRDEMTGFRFELGEGSQEFFVLKTIYESLQKKGDAEKLYSNFYRDTGTNATRYFKGRPCRTKHILILCYYFFMTK